MSEQTEMHWLVQTEENAVRIEVMVATSERTQMHVWVQTEENEIRIVVVAVTKCNRYRWNNKRKRLHQVECSGNVLKTHRKQWSHRCGDSEVGHQERNEAILPGWSIPVESQINTMERHPVGEHNEHNEHNEHEHVSNDGTSVEKRSLRSDPFWLWPSDLSSLVARHLETSWFSRLIS